MAIGAGYAVLGFSTEKALGLTLAWELLENLVIIPNTNWHGETSLNIIGDVFANMLGYFVAKGLV